MRSDVGSLPMAYDVIFEAVYRSTVAPRTEMHQQPKCGVGKSLIQFSMEYLRAMAATSRDLWSPAWKGVTA
jgi:hypothetical protein